MIPSLMIGDFILVNKFSYGFKVPFSDFFGDPFYISTPKKPKRGDVIVFKYPKDESINYIKRVIGVPGDTVEVKDKNVFINDQLIATSEIDGKEILTDMDDKFKNYSLRFFKTKTGEHEHIIQLADGNDYLADYDKRSLGPDEYFAMGDNRDFSGDSRLWGIVPFKNIKGEALFVWFSMIIPFGEDRFKFRPWRIGTVIH